MRSKKSPSDCWFQLPRNSSPTSAGPASPPIKSVPWQAEHRWFAVASPRLSCASVYTPLQTPEGATGAAGACAFEVTAEEIESASPTPAPAMTWVHVLVVLILLVVLIVVIVRDIFPQSQGTMGFSMLNTGQRLLLRAFLAAALFLGVQAALRAHDVPDEIDIQAYVKPQGANLQVLLRVPLLAVTDTNLPKDGTGYLAMRYLDPALGETANQISTGILFLENSERLSQFAMAGARISLPSDKSFDTYDGALTRVRGT